MPTILLVIGTLQAGGAERQLSDMASYWAARGWKVILATWCGSEIADFYPFHSNVVRKHLNMETGAAGFLPRVRLNLRRILKLRNLLSTIRPDAVLSFVTESNILTILAGLGLGIRVIVSERIQPALHTELPRTWYLLRKLLYRSADVVVAQTREAAHWLEHNCRTEASVIPNALRLLPEPSADKGFTVVAVGRLTHQKAFDVLLRAFALNAPGFAEWRLVVIGEGHERENLMRLRSELRLDPRVDFIGQTSNVR